MKIPNNNLKKGDLVIFPNPQIEKVNVKNLIKRIGYIQDNKAYVIGNTTEEIERISGIKGLVSFDSKFFGLVDTKDMQKVVYLPFISYVLQKLSTTPLAN